MRGVSRGTPKSHTGNAASAHRLTVLDVVGVRREAQGGGTVLALEAAPVEELALSTQPLHHVHPLLAEIAGVAAP